MSVEAYVWTVFLLPLASFLFIGLVVRPFLNRTAVLAGYLTVLAVGLGFLLSLRVLQAALDLHGEPVTHVLYTWAAVGDLQVRVGFLLDPLTAIMLVVVTAVSLMVQVYSLGYLRGDPGFARYYAYMSLFTASMVGLVLASNLVQLFIFWELVGVCSYLLIGFWYHRPAAASAAKKAFLVTRVGDFGFLLGILYLFAQRAQFDAAGLNVLDIGAIHEAARAGLLATPVLTWVALGLFAGAAGKSAQFPLHIWLPDAMEGPTPVSALIHAATMVAAGVFLVARFFPLFEAAPAALTVVALIGAFTALLAATMGMANFDIKRVLAYSTISQLGFMVAALGIGAYVAAVFHLVTHAFFKALLFLGAGSVNHATGTFDMRYMGGLRRAMPVTYVTFVIGGLSLAGVFPLAGFWSKDEILTAAWFGGGAIPTVVFWMLLAGVVLTGFYIARAVFMTFHGEFRGGVEAEQRERPPAHAYAGANPGDAHGHGAPAHDPAAGHGRVHLAESPAVMVLPLLLLALPAALIGYLAQPLGLPSFLGVPAHWLGHFLEASASAPVEPGEAPFTLPLAVLSLVAAGVGIGVAALCYLGRETRPIGAPEPLYHLVRRKYYLDDLAEGLIASKAYYHGLARFLRSFDQGVVDGIVDGVGWVARNVGRGVARLQTGQAQAYAAAISIGVVVILAAYLLVQR